MASSDVNHLSHSCIYGLGSSSAERKSRFLKWLSKIFKGGPNRGATSEQHPQFLGDENMVWRVPPRSVDDRSRTEREREELDHAIALLPADELKRPNGARPRTDSDGLTRELQDSPNMPSCPPYIPSYAPCTPIPHYSRGYRVQMRQSTNIPESEAKIKRETVVMCCNWSCFFREKREQAWQVNHPIRTAIRGDSIQKQIASIIKIN